MVTLAPSYKGEVASELSYKAGSKCCTNSSVSGVNTGTDSCGDTTKGSTDNASGRVDCTCGDDVERRDGSGGDEGGIDGDEGADMAKGEDGADSELDKFTSRSVDPQSTSTYRDHNYYTL